jgi:hypothetical protein
MKAGTASLWEYLRCHPDVFMSETKELDYFVSELNWVRGHRWYSDQFADGAGAGAIGEASTSYTKWPVYGGVAERIGEALPSIRLVYLVRNPVQRIRSQYLHQRLLKLERRPLERAVLEDSAYVAFSSYAMQLRRYLPCLPRDQILIVTSEALRHNRRATMDRVFDFIGVDPARGSVPDREFHGTAEKRVPRFALERVQRIAGYGRLARFAPGFLKEATRGVRTRGIDAASFTLPPEVHQELEVRLTADVALLRQYMPEGFDGWGIG